MTDNALAGHCHFDITLMSAIHKGLGQCSRMLRSLLSDILLDAKDTMSSETETFGWASIENIHLADTVGHMVAFPIRAPPDGLGYVGYVFRAMLATAPTKWFSLVRFVFRYEYTCVMNPDNS
jgi:hypothetical protein